jgi:hypothetical protein
MPEEIVTRSEKSLPEDNRSRAFLLKETEEPDFPCYKAYRNYSPVGNIDYFYYNSSNTLICQQIDKIIEQEGPVSINILARRVVEGWLMERVTSKAIRRIAQLVCETKARKLSCEYNEFYWPTHIDPRTYDLFRINSDYSSDNRDISDIPPEEIINAALYVIKSSISLPEDDLVRETAKTLGFKRLGQNVDNIIRIGIKIMLAKQKAVERNGMITSK